MKYGNIGEAMSFYNSSKQNIFKRGKSGSIPTEIIDGRKKYLLDESYMPKIDNIICQSKNKSTEPKVVKPTKPKESKPRKQKQGTPITDELYKEHFTIPKEVLIQEVVNNLADPSRIIKDLEVQYELTDTDITLIEDFATNYKSYRMLMDIANSDPVGLNYKPNPAFKEAREQFKLAMTIAQQIGIGALNRTKLKLEPKTKEVNPFEAFLQ